MDQSGIESPLVRRNPNGEATRAKRLRCQKVNLRTVAVLSNSLTHCRWPLGTHLVEGINNKINAIKRMTYGYPG